MSLYIPDRGDLIVVSFDPHAGHEQAGRRPALVLSSRAFNRGTNLIFCCPITNTQRRTLLHVPVPAGTTLTGFVMCEQSRALDFRVRRANMIGVAPAPLVRDVQAVLDGIIVR